MLKRISAVMQIALVLSDRMKSLSVTRIFSEYSFGISNLILKTLPMKGSACSLSSSSPLVSLTSLSFFISKFLVWVSLTLFPWTKYLSTSPSMAVSSSYQVVCPMVGLSPSNQTTSFLLTAASPLICQPVGCFAFFVLSLQTMHQL